MSIPKQIKNGKSMKRSLQIFICLGLFALTGSVFAAIPTTERTPTSASAPLNILSSQPDKIFVPTFGDFKNRFIFSFSGSTLTVINTETWAEYSKQPDAFSASIVDIALLGNGTSLIVALTGGNLARIELDDETTWEDTDTSTSSSDDTSSSSSDAIDDSREVDVSANMTSAGLSAITTNPDVTTETVYMINGSDGYYYEYNMTTESFSEVQLTTTDSSSSSSDSSSSTTTYSPVDIAYANASGGDTVLISTSEGTMLGVSPGTGSFSEVTPTADTTPTFSQMALTTDNAYAFIIDTTSDAVWVYSVSGGEFIDQTSSGTTLDPIQFDTTTENSGLTDIIIFADPDTSDDFAYVSGSDGLSIIDASSPAAKADTKIVDEDTSTADIYDPLSLSGTPGPLAASTTDDGYIYTANGDGTISVITDNPFVTITTESATSITQASSTFTITFQTDEAGTYTVRANSDPSATEGTEVISTTTVDATNTDTTTATIDINSYSRATFTEGDNLFFVFVTDASGHTGRDAVTINVDRPPEAITINSLSFGSSKLYATFTPSSDSDIADYTAYAEAAADQSNPTCPGSLTFDSATTATLTGSECSSASSCEIEITGLTNGTLYCVAMRATDNAAQAGEISYFADAATPEDTVGPAEFLGEKGCALDDSLYSHSSRRNMDFMISVILFSVLLSVLRWPKLGRDKKKIICLMLPALFASTPAHAGSAEHFTFELKGSSWIPTRSAVKEFFPACCNPIGEVEFGYIYKQRYNATVSTGMSYLSGQALGITSGLESGDDFALMTVPIRLDFIYRLRLMDRQLFVPYARAGFDSVYFRETTTSNNTIQGNKFGLHGGAGVSVQLDAIEGGGTLEHDYGINNVFFTLEGRFAYLNSFSSTGLDLSGFYPYAGLLFTF